jgi:hypothetical protein
MRHVSGDEAALVPPFRFDCAIAASLRRLLARAAPLPPAPAISKGEWSSVETLDRHPKARLDKEIHRAIIPLGERLQFLLHRWRAMHCQLALGVHDDALPDS